ncbi:MAG: YfjI family protein [Planctomycetota bacterium]
MTALTINPAEIERTLRLFHESGSVFEVRALDCSSTRGSGKPFTAAGFFNDPAKVAAEVAKLEARATAKGIYQVLNPVSPDLLALAEVNKLHDYAKSTTQDADILRVRWLYLDFDATRRAGISSTKAEVKAACEIARTARTWLESEQGWVAGVRALSGNGAHVLYPLDLPNDEASKDLLRRVLLALNARFGTDQVKVDPSCFNASRIAKLYGTIARKGSSTPERPHRLAALVYVSPGSLGIVSREKLEAVARLVPAEEKKNNPAMKARAEGEGLSPFEDFNSRGDVAALLEGAGWKRYGVERDGESSWTRPGGDGRCATLGHNKTSEGGPLLHAFSSNVSEFEVNKSYSPSQVFSRLRHGGRDSEAAKALLALGYGTPRNGKAGANGTTATSTAPEPWGDPIPMIAEANLPAFSLDTLPKWLGDSAESLAESLQCPPDLPALLGLAVAASALAGKYQIEAWPGWREPLNLYIVLVLPSGEMKSAVFGKVLAPVWEFERTLASNAEPKIANAKAEQRVLGAKVKAAEKALLNATKDAKATAESALREAELVLGAHVIPSAPILTVGDVTPEKLGDLMQANGERMLFAAAEGGVIETVTGRYNDGPANLDLFLGAYGGDRVRVDRISRPPVILREPLLTVGLTVQPEILSGFGARRELRGRGLLARLFYSKPVTRIGSREWKPRHRDFDAHEAYGARVKDLLTLPLPQAPPGSTVRPEVLTLKLAPEAQVTLGEYAADVEARMKPGGDLAHLRDWANRARGLALRVAGILHCGDSIGPGKSMGAPVTSATMERGVKLARYAEAHARAAHGAMGMDPNIEAACELLVFLADSRALTISRRDAYRALRGTVDSVDGVDAPLDALVAHGFLREQPAPTRKGPGRPPSAVFDVHPQVAEHAPQAVAADSVHSVPTPATQPREQEPTGGDPPAPESGDEEITV